MISTLQIDEVNAPVQAGRDRPVLLRAEGLSKAFGGQVVLDGVNVELCQGEVVLLRGENGSGKTTLLNILTGNLEPDAGAIHYLADGSPRSYHFPRRWWQELNPFDHFVPEFVAREGMGRTWQDVRLFGSQTLRDNITVAEPGHPGENPMMALITPSRSARKEQQLRDQADTILGRFGLAGREDSSADKISLGQSKRVAIARAVAAGAKILFLDEPLAGLDRQGIADVLGLLKTLVRDHTLTLVIVEHVFNQPHLHDLVTTDWLLESGKLTNSLRSAHPESEIRNPKSEVSSRPPWFHLLVGENADIIDEPLPRGAHLTRIRRADRYDPSGAPVLEIRDLVVKRGPRIVVAGAGSDSSGMTLTVNAGEIAILQAPNGWGKSTLVATICGTIPFAEGKIVLCSKDISNMPTWGRIRLGLGVLLSGEHTFSGLEMQEVLPIARLASSATITPDLPRNRKCSELSGGQQQRLALELCINRESDSIRILDEPFSMLDAKQGMNVATQLLTHSRSALLIVVPSSTSTEER